MEAADRKRLAAAFAVAAISDGLSFWLIIALPVQWAVDLVTALLLFLLLGRKWVIPLMAASAVKRPSRVFRSASYRGSGTVTCLVCAPFKHSISDSQLASI